VAFRAIEQRERGPPAAWNAVKPREVLVSENLYFEFLDNCTWLFRLDYYFRAARLLLAFLVYG
jgi:hypothetical protein